MHISIPGPKMINKISSIILFLILSLVISISCSDRDTRKIKLAETGDVVKTSGPGGTSVLKVSPEQQKTLVIRHFKNHTGDQTLEWLERGLMDMLITEFSQSPYLNIIAESQFLDVARKMGKTETQLENRIDEIRVAKNTSAQILLCGHISYYKNVLRIEIDVTDVLSGADMGKEMVEGEGMEKLFSMVDELSGKLRHFLREKGQEQKFASIKPSEMTSSLEAFRCYSKALQNREKYMYASAEECLEEAIRYDSTFASAYLKLIIVKRALKKSVNLQEYIAKSKRYIHKLSYADKVSLDLIDAEMSGEPSKIFFILEEAIEKSPMDLELRLALAQQYRMWGQENKALQEYEELLEMDPKHKIAYNDLGYLFSDMGDFKTALYMLDKYQELAPDEPNPHDSKGEILLFAGKFTEAAEEYKNALAIMPGYYSSAFKLSEIYTELGDKEKAFRYLNQGLKYVPDTGFERSSDFLRARIHWRFGDFAKADNYMLGLLQRHPLMSGYLIRRIEMYRSAGKEDQAKKIEMEAFDEYRKQLQSQKGSDIYGKSFLEFITYSDLSLDKAMPLIGQILEHSGGNLDDLNIGLISAFYSLSQGKREGGINAFKEKMPRLILGLKLQKKNISWGSTWKNLFRFFDEEAAGREISQIFSTHLSELAEKESRKDLEFISQMAKARVYGRENKNEESDLLYLKYGVPTEKTWKICGPFRSYKYSGFDHAFPPERETNLSSTYKNNSLEIKWIDGDDDHHDGHVDLANIFRQNQFATAYSLIYINSPDERKVQIRLGSDESCKLWLNDELIWQHYIKRGAVVDRDIITVVLHSGYNKVLLKINNTDLDWGFYFRVTDEEGNGISDIKFTSPSELESSLASNDILN
jgi:tetratricopeptide (TPR) repeat protein